jgi:serine/threonine protein kinase/uncharacterized membrane protein
LKMTDGVGQQLGNYRLIRLLGHGGYANVYLGEHLYLKTEAAIKVLQVQLGDDERNNFLDEARTIAHLVHPHIIRVLDFGVQGYMPFLVMDYAPNGTLRERHPRGTQVPLATILAYVKQVASALQYAHDQNLIHRDVKPGNMLLGRNDEILLSDFGIALIAESSHSQSTQDTVGTVAYMAPEQIEGKPRPASDQYSLGIVVYEWLCGERPFHGSLTEIATQQLATPPPSLRARVPSISPEVENVVMKALAKDPHARFPSVEAFADALEQASKSRPSTSKATKTATFPLYSPSQPATAPSPPLSSGQPAMVLPSAGQSTMAAQQTEMAPRANNNYRTWRKPLTASPSGKLFPTDDWRTKKGGASFGLRPLVAMLLGAALYTAVGYFINILSLQQQTFASYALFDASVIIPLFFGVVFGPFVGLITGVGYFLGHYLSGSPFYWYNGIGIALTGLVAGLAWLRTRGHYNTSRSIVTAEFFAAMGVIVGEGFADCGSVGVSQYPFLAGVTNFLTFSLFELLFGLILLPIALTAYNAITRPRLISQ